MTAGRPKKVLDNVSSGNNLSNDDLRKQLETLQSQINGLMKKNKTTQQERPDNGKVLQDDYIPIMSLRTELLTLSTERYGKGTIYDFNNFGQIDRIIYSDLVKIINAHRNFVEEGFFYILDERVRHIHGLDNIYEKILSKEQIENIFNNPENDVVKIFKSANSSQQQLIIHMAIDKVVNREEIDMNIVDKLARVSGMPIQESINDKRLIVEEFMATKKDDKK